jgi:transposase-like protein
MKNEYGDRVDTIKLDRFDVDGVSSKYLCWISTIEACQKRPKGTSVSQWLRENNINEQQFYRWFRKFSLLLHANTKDMVKTNNESQGVTKVKNSVQESVKSENKSHVVSANSKDISTVISKDTTNKTVQKVVKTNTAVQKAVSVDSNKSMQANKLNEFSIDTVKSNSKLVAIIKHNDLTIKVSEDIPEALLRVLLREILHG